MDRITAMKTGKQTSHGSDILISKNNVGLF